MCQFLKPTKALDLLLMVLKKSLFNLVLKRLLCVEQIKYRSIMI
jgi:hypothetical protein